MSDRRRLRRILELAATLALLVTGVAGVVYAIAIAVTLQELRTLEPIAMDGHPDLEIWRCPAAIGSAGASAVADAESKVRGTGPVHAPTGAERSANCAPGGRQARPQ